MSYSDINPAWDRMHRTRHDAQIQFEIRRANQLQKHHPTMSRSEALRLAADQIALEDRVQSKDEPAEIWP